MFLGLYRHQSRSNHRLPYHWYFLVGPLRRHHCLIPSIEFAFRALFHPPEIEKYTVRSRGARGPPR